MNQQAFIPILRDHDQTKPLGWIKADNAGSLLFEFKPAISEADAFEIFGGAGIQALDQRIIDGVIYILKGRILEFSLCPKPVAQKPPPSLSKAATDVLAERHRQIIAEGWTPEHDDIHHQGELACAAACYAAGTVGLEFMGNPVWPLGWEFKPADERRMLVKAGALILAEIERLDRKG